MAGKNETEEEEPGDKSSASEPDVESSLPEMQVCRLCKKEVPVSELITTCLCPSPLSRVHQACIESHIEVTGARFCSNCKFPYSIRHVRRYSLLEGILIYNQHDLKMIWKRLLGLLLTMCVTMPVITCCMQRLLAIEAADAGQYTLFTATAVTFVFYTLLVLSIYVAVCTTIVMVVDPLLSWFSWWDSVTRIRFGPMPKFNF